MLNITRATFEIEPSARSREQGVTKPYTVTVEGNGAHCDCVGYGFKEAYKHTRAALAFVRAVESELAGEQLPLRERGVLNKQAGWSLV